MMSSGSSMPTLMRTRPGSTPASASCCSLSWAWVVDAGWMTSVFASPMLARWLARSTLSMKRCRPRCPRPSLDAEAEHRARPFGRYFFARSWCGCARQARPVHELDARVGDQPLGDELRVVDVRLHPERQRLDAQREQERRVRRERRADVAQLLGAQPGEEAVLAEVAVPVEAAVVRHLLVEQRELARSPSGSARSRRRRRRASCRAPPRNLVAEWMTMSAPHSIGRLRYGVETVESMMSGMPASCATSASPSMSAISPDGFAIVSAKIELGLVGDRRGVVGRVRRAHEGRVDAEAAQGDVELRDRAAVEVGARDDVVAGARERGEGDELARRGRMPWRRRRGRPRGSRCAPRSSRPSGWRAGCRCCRTSAGRSGPRHPRCRRRRTRWTGRWGARASRSPQSGMLPAWMARVLKPQSRSKVLSVTETG